MNLKRPPRPPSVSSNSDDEDGGERDNLPTISIDMKGYGYGY